MKSLIVLLAICTLGYAADHWRDLTERHSLVGTAEPHGLIIYETKSCPACLQLESELTKNGIAYQRRDVGDEGHLKELTEKLARVGKTPSSVPVPVAEIDGVLVEKVSLKEILRRVR